MSISITPNTSELAVKSDDELRECLSELNNASLKKIAREAIHANTTHRKHIQYQSIKIDKLEKRLNSVARLAEREIE